MISRDDVIKNFKLQANSFRCQCPNGFNGTTCDEPIDYCLVNNRCLNGAACRNLPESASIACDCPEGFEGVYCQDDVNECAIVPAICLNNAQCQNFVSYFLYTVQWDSNSMHLIFYVPSNEKISF